MSEKYHCEEFDCDCIGAQSVIDKLQTEIEVYKIQCQAAMRATSFGLCKKAIKYALEQKEQNNG